MPLGSPSMIRRCSRSAIGRAASSAALAQAYPNKPIKAIVPFAAGSATDQIGRAFAAKISETLGQPVVVENRPGASGLIASDWLRRHRRPIRLTGGIILLTVGALMLAGLWEPVITWLQSRLINNFRTII